MRTSPQAPVFVGIGANIEPERNIAAALKMLMSSGLLLAASAIYRSRACAMPAGTADFLNLAVGLRWDGDLVALKRELLRIETALGRDNRPAAVWRSRPIDLDILAAGNLRGSYGRPPSAIPHPDIEHYAHVAVPLADLASQYRHPISGRTYADIAATHAPHDLEPVDPNTRIPTSER